MNPEKSQHKLDVIFDIGAELDDNLEVVEKETHVSEGGSIALSAAHRKMGELLNVIDKEVASTELTPAQAVVARKYVNKCLDFLENFAKAAEVKLAENRGKASAFKHMRDRTKARYDAEQAAIESFKAAVERARHEAELAAKDPEQATRVPPPPAVARAAGLPVGKPRKRK
jgi:hypothetical protein